MKLIKKIIYLILKPLLNFLFLFFRLDEKNLKKKLNFEYIEKKNEIINLSKSKYYIHNKKKNFLFLNFKNLKLPKYYSFISDNNFALSSGDYPVFFNKNFRVYMDSINLNIRHLLSSGIFNQFINLYFYRDIEVLEKVISFSGSMADNKFHWLIDYMPRLQYVIDNDLVNQFTYIIHKNNNSLMKFYLNILGVENKNIYIWDSRPVFIKKLYIYSLRYLNFSKNKYQIYSHSSILWLKKLFDNKFQNITTLQKYKKIFILRRKKDSRNIYNIDDIKKYFIKNNYIFIYLEDFSEKEIIQIFKSAEIIICVHGAALSNVIFSKNLKIIEIYPHNRIEEDAFVYYQLSRILNIEHHLFIADKIDLNNGILLDIKLFKEKLVNIL